ncbi:MAG: hypothetical protein ACK5NY_01485 [Burkholderiaceae bacterium]
MKFKPFHFLTRLKFSAWHLLVCLCIASLIFCFVRFVWFPGKYWNIADGKGLFLLITGVDIVLGPLITFFTVNLLKSRKERWFDWSCVGALQIAALAYGLHTIYIARPAFVVYAIDRFNVVAGADLDKSDLQAAADDRYRKIPFWGPLTVSTRMPRNPQEKLQLLDDGLKGKDIELQPKFYTAYEQGCTAMKARMRPLADLRPRNAAPAKRPVVNDLLAAYDTQRYAYLPVVARSDWVAVLDRQSCAIAQFYPLNGF